MFDNGKRASKRNIFLNLHEPIDKMHILLFVEYRIILGYDNNFFCSFLHELAALAIFLFSNTTPP